jgi:hypothetical protein
MVLPQWLIYGVFAGATICVIAWLVRPILRAIAEKHLPGD